MSHVDRSRFPAGNSKLRSPLFLTLLLTACAPRLSRFYTFTQFAGSEGGPGYADGEAHEARFLQPHGLALDADGYLYVSDRAAHTIRKVSPDGTVSTLAGLAGEPGAADGRGHRARFHRPTGLALDGGGNLYVADTFNQQIRRITPEGDVSTVAARFGTADHLDEVGVAACFHLPAGVAFDRHGLLYVADEWNHSIRVIDQQGNTGTLAGQLGTVGASDGVGGAAQFNQPTGIAVDRDGNLIIADRENHTIRRIDRGGRVTTIGGVAGDHDDRPGRPRYHYPQSVKLAHNGDIYIADTNNCSIRKLDRMGGDTILAGESGPCTRQIEPGEVVPRFKALDLAVAPNGDVWYTNSSTVRRIAIDGEAKTAFGTQVETGWRDGSRSEARFSWPSGMAPDQSGGVYVADSGNHTIRRIDAAGIVTTIAGTPGQAGFVDGDRHASRFDSPRDVALDPAGILYVADTGNCAVRRINPSGAVTTQLRSDQCEATSPWRRYPPTEIACDGAGRIYLLEGNRHTLRVLSPDGRAREFAGLKEGWGDADGPAAEARFGELSGLAIDPSWGVTVIDRSLGKIRRISVEGIVSTLTPVDQRSAQPVKVRGVDLAITPEGDMLIVESHRLLRVSADGRVLEAAGWMQPPGDGAGTHGVASFYHARGVAAGRDGTVWVATPGGIRRGRPALRDRSSAERSVIELGDTIRLDARPRSARSWRWHVVRRPAGARCAFSSSSVRNPSFRPDVAGLYVFRLDASRGDVRSITEVEVETIHR